jgi:hypothetical protein
MKRVYEARDGLEAHMVAGLLEQAGLLAQVNGDMLQGGVGELPALGLASVWVADSDEDRARELIEDFEARQPPPGEPSLRERLRPPEHHHEDTRRAFRHGLLIGLVIGAVAALWLLWHG